MLKLEMNDGTTREMNVKEVAFDTMGVTFNNVDLKCKECVTYDKIKRVTYEFDVTKEAADQSKKIQFNASDARPRRNTTMGLQS